jgi:5-methylcytosine-specific restriction endonuclease McrA
MRKREIVAMLRKAQGGKCALCLAASDVLELDHIVPRACGGSDEMPNLQLLCVPCNRSKAATMREGDPFGLWDQPQNIKSSRFDKMDTRAYWRQYRATKTKKLRAAGICIVCAKNPVPEGRSTCSDCGAKANARNKGKPRKRRAA